MARVLYAPEPQTAMEGSYYTIIGAGGDLDEWIDGYEGLLEKAGIGKPKEWFTLTGAEVNVFARPTRSNDAFPADLIFLLFPLEGLNIGKLAIFKLTMEDRWFDDIIDNMRRDQS